MARACRVESDGSLVIGERRHQIPQTFSERQIHSFQTLLEPIPDSPSGPTIPMDLRRRQREYLLRRALAAVIPGLPLEVLKKLPIKQVKAIHEWIASNRPELVAGVDAID